MASFRTRSGNLRHKRCQQLAKKFIDGFRVFLDPIKPAATVTCLGIPDAKHEKSATGIGKSTDSAQCFGDHLAADPLEFKFW